jgi:hypothetical protein
MFCNREVNYSYIVNYARTNVDDLIIDAIGNQYEHKQMNQVSLM